MPDTLHRRFHDAESTAEPDNDLQLRSLLAVEDGAVDLSITWVRIDGRHQRLRTDASTRIYVVIAGRGTVTVGEEPLAVDTGDVVVIPPGRPYHLQGDMTYLVLNHPGFREGDDLYLDADDEVVGTVPASRTPPPAQER